MASSMMRSFADWVKESPLALAVTLISLITFLIGAAALILNKPRIALVVTSGLGSVLLIAYNVWIVDARKSPRSRQRKYSRRFRFSVHATSVFVLLVCWAVVVCLAPDRRGGYVLIKLGSRLSSLGAMRLGMHLQRSPEDAVAWCWLARVKLNREEHAEIEEDIRGGPTEADASYWRGRICDADGNTAEAAVAFKACIESDPAYLQAYTWYVGTCCRMARAQKEELGLKFTIECLKSAETATMDGISHAISLRDGPMLAELRPTACMIKNDLAYAYAEGKRADWLTEAEAKAREAVEMSDKYGLSPSLRAACRDTLAYVKLCREDLEEIPNGQALQDAKDLLEKAEELLGPAELQGPHERAIQGYIQEHMRLLETLRMEMQAEDE